MNRPALRAIALAVLAATIVPATTMAQPKPADSATAGGTAPRDEAQRRYMRALELFGEGTYDAALLEFRRAYELSPSWKILYNIGQVHRQLNDYARALEALQRYLNEGGAEVPAARVTEVKGQIEKLQGRVASLEITTNVADAEVLIDDLPVGKTPFDKPLVVNVGRRKVSVTAKGRLPETRIVEAAGGDKLKVPFELLSPESDRPADSANTATVAPLPPEAPLPSKFFWPGAVATGALGVGTVVVGVLALGATRSFDDTQGKFGVTRSELDKAHSKASTFSLITDVLLGATLVTGGVTAYLSLRTPTREPASTVGVRLGPTNVSVLGTFLGAGKLGNTLKKVSH